MMRRQKQEMVWGGGGGGKGMNHYDSSAHVGGSEVVMGTLSLLGGGREVRVPCSVVALRHSSRDAVLVVCMTLQ